MRDRAVVLVPFVLIIIAEAFFFIKDSSTSLTIHLFNVFICVLLGFFIERYSDLFQALMLVSLIRVLNLAMPTFFDEKLYMMPLIYGTLILSAYILWRLAMDVTSQQEESGMGIVKTISIHVHRALEFFNGGTKERRSQWDNLYLPAAVILGLVLANLEYQVLGPEPLIPDLSLVNMALLAVIMFVFVGFAEELIFRGYLQTRIENHWGIYPAMLGSALLFSVMHSGYYNVAYLFLTFFVGLILAALFWRTRSLAFVVLIHGFLNFFLFSILPNGWAIRF
jgi:uncharacterized protein